jgi:biopolymer transport protein ExbB
MTRRDALAFIVCCLLLPPAGAQELNLASQLAEGGMGVLVIGALSVLALAVSFERLANFRAQKVAPQGLADEALSLWRAGEYARLAARAGESRSSLARVLEFMAGHPRLPVETLSARAAEIASRELRLQQQKAYALNVVATIAPIVGLLGTVVGMIEAFHVIAFNGMGDPTLLAGGISKALVNTAAGLSVALPSLAMHHFFRNRMVGIGITLERQLGSLLDEARGSDQTRDQTRGQTRETGHAH